MGAMEALLWLAGGCLCIVGAVVAMFADKKWTPKVALLGAALLLAGGALLAFFVFSGDPYTNGTPSRWANRDAHGPVYASWIATTLGAVGLFALSRRSRPRWLV